MIEEYEIAIRPEAEAGLTAMLRSGIYKDPISVAIRETLANAMDIHREYSVKTPIQVTIFKDRISIRDFGPGIGQDTIRQTFFAYGGSTKVHDKNQIGGFGIGAKAPLCYSDTMTVRSIHRGTLAVWTAAVDEAGGRIYNILEEKTNEPSGLEVTIPLAQADQSGNAIGHIAVYLLMLNIGQSDSGQRVNVVFGDQIDCTSGCRSSDCENCYANISGVLTLIPNPLQKVMKEDPVLSRIYNIGIEEGIFVPAWHMDTILSVTDSNGVVCHSWNVMMNLCCSDFAYSSAELPDACFKSERFLISGAELIGKTDNISHAKLTASFTTSIVSGSYILRKANDLMGSGDMNVSSILTFSLPHLVIRQPIGLLKFTAGRCTASTSFVDPRWTEAKYPFHVWDIFKLANELKVSEATDDLITLIIFLKSVSDLFPLVFVKNDSWRNSYSSERQTKWKSGFLKRKRTFTKLESQEISPAGATNLVRYVYDVRLFSTAPDVGSIKSVIPVDRISAILGSISLKFGAIVLVNGSCAKNPVRKMIESHLIGTADYWGRCMWQEVFHVSDKLSVRRASKKDESIGIADAIYVKTPSEDAPRKYPLVRVLGDLDASEGFLAFSYRKTHRSQKTRSIYRLCDPVAGSDRGMSRIIKDHTPYILQKLEITKKTLVFPEYPTSEEVRILRIILCGEPKEIPSFDGIVFQKEGCDLNGHKEFRKFVERYFGASYLRKMPMHACLRNFRKHVKDLKLRYEHFESNAFESASLAANIIVALRNTNLFRSDRSSDLCIWESSSVLEFWKYHLGEKRYQTVIDWSKQVYNKIPDTWKDKLTCADAYYEAVLAPYTHYDGRLRRRTSDNLNIRAVPDFLMKAILELSDKTADIIDKLSEGWKYPTQKLPKLW